MSKLASKQQRNEKSRCAFCKRPIWTDESLAKGVGPICEGHDHILEDVKHNERLTVSQLAEEVSLSKATILREIARGELKAEKQQYKENRLRAEETYEIEKVENSEEFTKEQKEIKIEKIKEKYKNRISADRIKSKKKYDALEAKAGDSSKYLITRKSLELYKKKNAEKVRSIGTSESYLLQKEIAHKIEGEKEAKVSVKHPIEEINIKEM